LHTARIATFVPYNREQTFLLPPNLKAWLPAVQRLPLTLFPVNPQAGGKPQCRPLRHPYQLDE